MQKQIQKCLLIGLMVIAILSQSMGATEESLSAALCQVIEEKNFDLIEPLVENGTPNKPVPPKWLSLSAKTSHLHKKLTLGFTPLRHAMDMKPANLAYKVVKILLKHGADTNIEDGFGNGSDII